MVRISLIVFYIILIVGIILIPITYIMSNVIAYTHHANLNLGDYSMVTVPLPLKYGKIKIVGNINGSANLYLINQYLARESYLGNLSGNVNIVAKDNGYTGLFIVNGLYPSNISLTIFIYDTSFEPIGYTTAGLLLAISLILGFYVFRMGQENIKTNRNLRYARKTGKRKY